MLSFALVTVLLICLIHFMIGLFVLLKNKNNKTNQIFFGATLATIGWLLTNQFSNSSSQGLYTALIFNKAVFVFPAIAAFFFLRFALLFTGAGARLRVRQDNTLLLISVAFTLACMTSLVVAGVEPSADGVYEIIFGPLAGPYAAYLVAYFGCTFLLFLYSMRHSKGSKKARLQYMVAGILASFLSIIITNLILPLAGNFSLLSYGPVASLFLIGGFSYAIVKHRLFDIRLIVARSVTYVLLLIFMGVTYGLGIFSLSLVLSPNGQFSSIQNIISIIAALILAFTFQPLRRLFELITDRLFYRERYDSQEVINDFTKILVSELDLDLISNKSLKVLCEHLKIGSGQLIIFNNNMIYRTEYYGSHPSKSFIGSELMVITRPLIVTEDLKAGKSKSILDSYNARISVALRTKEDFVGYMFLGDKLSGDIYSDQDIRLLEILGKELAVAILNAKAYAEIQEFNETLQARVDHATGRLRVANRHLKELDHAKDEFISMASHQLRTPLTTIKGYLSMMDEGDAGKLTKAQKEFVGYAFDSSERMVSLISDLLNVSRLSAGRFMIQRKPTDMVALVKDEVRQLMTHAVAKGINLVFEPPARKLELVDIDDNKTRQVVMNFIDNAIYYTPTGTVRVVLEQDGGVVRLKVQDTGIGVPEVAKKKLFSKFFRADNAQGVRPDGTGLGLYLAKRVVEDQGGTIIFDSAQGKGSTFGFELPLKVTAKQPQG